MMLALVVVLMLMTEEVSLSDAMEAVSIMICDLRFKLSRSLADLVTSADGGGGLGGGGRVGVILLAFLGAGTGDGEAFWQLLLTTLGDGVGVSFSGEDCGG